MLGIIRCGARPNQRPSAQHLPPLIGVPCHPAHISSRAGAQQSHSADTLKVVSMAYLLPNMLLFQWEAAREPCLLAR